MNKRGQVDGELIFWSFVMIVAGSFVFTCIYNRTNIIDVMATKDKCVYEYTIKNFFFDDYIYKCKRGK